MDGGAGEREKGDAGARVGQWGADGENHVAQVKQAPPAVSPKPEGKGPAAATLSGAGGCLVADLLVRAWATLTQTRTIGQVTRLLAFGRHTGI